MRQRRAERNQRARPQAADRGARASSTRAVERRSCRPRRRVRSTAVLNSCSASEIGCSVGARAPPGVAVARSPASERRGVVAAESSTRLRRRQPGTHRELPVALGASPFTTCCWATRRPAPPRRRSAAPPPPGAISAGVQPSRAASLARCRRARERATQHRRRRQRPDDAFVSRARNRPASRTSASAAKHAGERERDRRRDDRRPTRGSGATRRGERLAGRVADVRRASRHERQDAHRQRRQDVGLIAALVLPAPARLQVVGDGQRRDVDVLAEEAVAQQPHDVLELDVAPRRHDHVLVAVAADRLERRQRQRARLELVDRRHDGDAGRSR